MNQATIESKKEPKKPKSALRDTAKIITINKLSQGQIVQIEGRTTFQLNINPSKSEEMLQSAATGNAKTVVFASGNNVSMNFTKFTSMSKIHILGTVLNIEKQGNITNILIDDGTGSIIIRSFEENKTIESLTTNKIIRCIGRIREYNEQIYIFPEIIKETNTGWLHWLHSKLNNSKETSTTKKAKTKTTKQPKSKMQNLNSAPGKSNFPSTKTEIEPIQKQIKAKKDQEAKQNLQIEVKNNETKPKIEKPLQTKETPSKPKIPKQEEQNQNPYELLINIIKNKDSGQGVPIESIIQETKENIKEASKFIEKMLEQGDIFQNAPGKVKVL